MGRLANQNEVYYYKFDVLRPITYIFLLKRKQREVDVSDLFKEVNDMNKSELIAKVAETSELSKKDATKAVEAVFEAIADALQSGDKVQLVGFGNFEVRERSARKGRNPQTGDEIEISASKVPSFRPGKQLREGIR